MCSKTGIKRKKNEGQHLFVFLFRVIILSISLIDADESMTRNADAL